MKKRAMRRALAWALTLAMVLSAVPLGIFAEETEAQNEQVQTEAVSPEAPGTEAVPPEAPKAESPKAEEPKTEEPKTEEPKTEEPKTEEPKAEVPKTQEAAPEGEHAAHGIDVHSADGCTCHDWCDGKVVGGCGVCWGAFYKSYNMEDVHKVCAGAKVSADTCICTGIGCTEEHPNDNCAWCRANGWQNCKRNTVKLTVTFDPNYEGANKADIGGVQYNTNFQDVVNQAGSFSRPGYRFTGWYQEADCAKIRFRIHSRTEAT